VKTKVGDEMFWQAPVKLAAPRAHEVAGRLIGMDGVDKDQHKHSPEVVIEVRRVAQKSTSSGVWKWFIATFIVVGVLVWLAIRSGASA
jgi:hypothetical protein